MKIKTRSEDHIITRKGLEPQTTTANDPPIRNEVEFCKRWINANCKMTSRCNHDFSSYGLKHLVERDSQRKRFSDYFYVSNGAFIQAAVELGYKYKRVTLRDTPFPSFNVFLNLKIKGGDDAEYNYDSDIRIKNPNWSLHQKMNNLQIHWKLRQREEGE